MFLSRVEVKNFRLLADVEINLEEGATLIVGRNNSGKTSLTELFRRLLSGNSPRFRLEDFSLSVQAGFLQAFMLKRQGAEESDIREALPSIKVRLTIHYSKTESSLAPLSEFIIDLNPDCTDALVEIVYELKAGQIDPFFDEIELEEVANQLAQKTAFYREMKDRVPDYYTSTVRAVDPNDETNQKTMDFSVLQVLVPSGFINAQRGLDDITHKESDVLGRILEALFETARSDSADPSERAIARKLDDAVEEMQKTLDVDFNTQLTDLLPAFSLFGYPGLSDPQLRTETTLDVQRLLTDHTRVHYAGVDGVNLPEAYNGLGVRNLIFILLKLLEFYKWFMSVPASPVTHLIFIEEPEVHLHPQMAEVFISKLAEVAKLFARKFNKSISWPVQFVVTTHSSHIANRALFDSMRYFLAATNPQNSNVRFTIVKDLRQGLGATATENRKFLQEYMTLTRCDLLFADKAVLIEGLAERILLPVMIQKVDKGAPIGTQLSSQYVSVVEVGGAYAHIFFDLLRFLNLRTLIITDLDTVGPNASGKACKVSKGTHTSNGCIKKWFDQADCSPPALIAKSDSEKTRETRRLAYQIPEVENGPCGRSFEAAFILANPSEFQLVGSTAATLEDQAWTKAASIEKKSDFALKYAIEKTEWVVPRYVSEGLRWLAGESAEVAASIIQKQDKA